MPSLFDTELVERSVSGPLGASGGFRPGTEAAWAAALAQTCREPRSGHRSGGRRIRTFEG
jgi:hypothetical protein